MSNIKFPAVCLECGRVTLFDTKDEQERAHEGEPRCSCGGPLCACESYVLEELRDTLHTIEAESTDDTAREWARRALEEFGGLA